MTSEKKATKPRRKKQIKDALTSNQVERIQYLDNIVKTDGRGAVLVDNSFSSTTPPIPRNQPNEGVWDIAFFEPDEGWDSWYTNMTLEAVPHSHLHTLSSMIANFKLVPNEGDIETSDYLNALLHEHNFLELVRCIEYERQAYGRSYLYPYFGDQGRGPLLKLKNVDPTRVRVIRDNEQDFELIYELGDEEADKIFTELREKGKDTEAKNTGRIVGFLLELITDEEAAALNKSRRERKNKNKTTYAGATTMVGSPTIDVPNYYDKEVIQDDTDVMPKKVFFDDDELIVFFRYPSGIFPDGLSLLRAEYTLLVNKLYMEWAAVAAFAKTVAPTYVVKVPRVFAGLKDEVREELQKVKEEPGSDIIVDYHPDFDITPSDVMLGIGRNATDILNYIKTEWTIGTGMFDAMFESKSANRSTAEVQSDLFMRKIKSFRDDLEFTLSRRLFRKIMDNAHGIERENDPNEPLIKYPYKKEKEPYTLPSWRWGALVEKDKIGFLSAYVPFTMHMDRAQIDYVLEEYGDLPKRAEEPVGVLGQFNPYQPYQAGQEGFAGGRKGENPQSIEQKTQAGGGVPPKGAAKGVTKTPKTPKTPTKPKKGK